jgi:hypothetical protein
MLEAISAQELTEWQAYAELEPFGFWRDHFHFGFLCSLLANIHRRKGAPTAAPGDFMPFYEKPPMTQEQMMRLLDQTLIAAAPKQKPAKRRKP